MSGGLLPAHASSGRCLVSFRNAPPERTKHRRDLEPGELEAVVRQVAERLDAAMAEERFADLPLARISSESFLAAGERGPLWPLRMGKEAVFTCPADVVGTLERMCEGTDLATLGHDLLGRAYELHLSVQLTRVPGADRADALAGGPVAHEAA
jgi:hypothetical protein